MSLHPHPAAQRQDRHQVRAGLLASQVPSQAPRFIFLSSPPTASSFPSQSPHLSGSQASPSSGHLAASQTKGSQVHLIDRKTEVQGKDMTYPKGSASAAYWFLVVSISQPCPLHHFPESSTGPVDLHRPV